MSKKHYDAEFKKEIAQIYLDGRRTATSLSDELGLHVNTIYKWAEQYKTDPDSSFPGSRNMMPEDAELKKAQRRIRDLEEEVEILKKRRHTSQRTADKVRFIYKHRLNYAVKKLCRIIEVSRSGYYQWIANGCPKRQDKDAVVIAKIRQIERDNDYNYGVQRVYESLNKEHNIRCGCGWSKVQRIMHQNGIQARIKNKYKPQMTKADPNEQAFLNRLNQDFDVPEFNKVWLADITYIRTNGKWSYRAAVMDLGRRKIVGWAPWDKAECRTGLQALRQAINKEHPGPSLIHHPDRGSQVRQEVA